MLSINLFLYTFNISFLNSTIILSIYKAGYLCNWFKLRTLKAHVCDGLKVLLVPLVLVAVVVVVEAFSFTELWLWLVILDIRDSPLCTNQNLHNSFLIENFLLCLILCLFLSHFDVFLFK